MIGVVTAGFVFAPEYESMTGANPFARGEVKRVEGLVANLLGLTR